MRILLLDADGVVLNKGEYFSERFAREYQLPIENVTPFFKGPFVLCQKGEADLKEELEPYLQKWNWTDGVDAFLSYWFDSDVVLNENTQFMVAQFKEKGVQCYLASNNEKYRAQVISELLKGTGLFDGFYFSAELKICKEDPEFFEYIIKDLRVSPEDVYFIDNDQKNVEAAHSVGIHASLYNEHILADWLNKI